MNLQDISEKEEKSFYIRTYGCQMNELDTELMVGQLESRGWQRTREEEDADLLLFNTCSIRDLAERKVMGKIGKLGKSRQKKLIALTGCMAMAKGESLFRKFPHLNLVLGTNNIGDLGNVLDEVIATGKQIAKTDKHFEEDLDYFVAKRDDRVKAYVSIIRGCDKFCTYCVVPYTRGQEVSRPLENIVEECKRLVEQGYREITLLGQNVNSYGKDFKNSSFLFHDLLHRLDAIDGLERIRFMTSHPVDITRDLMIAIAQLPTLCDFVHFPLQAGSDRILRKMHRMYSVEEYVKKVEMLRSFLPSLALGTDIIVGFPTETEEEFQETYDIYEKLQYSVGFIFAYSPRKGTPAMRWKDDIPEEVKQERLQRLLQLQSRISTQERRDMQGREMDILFEKSSERHPGLLQGRTSCWKNCLVQAPSSLVGHLRRVKIKGFTHQTLQADLV